VTTEKYSQSHLLARLEANSRRLVQIAFPVRCFCFTLWQRHSSPVNNTASASPWPTFLLLFNLPSQICTGFLIMWPKYWSRIMHSDAVFAECKRIK